MKKITLILTLIIITVNCFSQAPSWAWAASPSGIYAGNINSTCTDANGNIYITGQFGGSSITFGSYVLTNNGNPEIFIVKYDENGNVLWAKQSSNGTSSIAFSICVDNSGNIYVAGSYGDSITLGNITLTSSAYENMFIAKYDTNGNVLWAKDNYGTQLYTFANSICSDSYGNTYVIGSFFDSISFGSIGLVNVNPACGRDLFVVKYDASGNVIWAKSAGGSANDQGFSI